MRRVLLLGRHLGPRAPRMALERALPIRFEKFHELPALGGGEARADANVLESPVVVEEAEEQRAERDALSVLVPAEACHHAITLALVLHLEHDALVRLVRSVLALRDHAVEPGALEPAEPVGGNAAVSR